MRWRGRRKSRNVEDRRRRGPRAAGMGLAGLLIAAVVAFATGDPSALFSALAGTAQQSLGARPALGAEEEDELAEFVSVVLADTEQVWHELLSRQGQAYREPTLTLFTGSIQSDCGFASAQVGPFYCPADETIYIDLSFFAELERRFGAPGDFAQAYVVAHEVGHHVQNLLGVSGGVHARQRRLAEPAANELSVRLELQADFYAGVWAHHADRRFDVLEAGDLEEALNAAAQIGDDRLQQRSGGVVVPDSFTHGTSEQRARWFRRGFESGDVSAGDTFGASRL